MMNYLLANNLLSAKQYGFIKNRSTSLQLLKIMDKWTEYLEYGGQELFMLEENTKGTRGHSLKLAKMRCTRDCWRHFFLTE